MKIFKKTFRYALAQKKKDMPNGLWSKCAKCSHIIFNKILLDNLKVCPKCDAHFSLTAPERIGFLIDKGTFIEYFADMQSEDPLNFSGPKSYKEKLIEEKQLTNLKEAGIVGEGKINNRDAALGVTDSRFIMGSMGSVVGEKIARLAEFAINKAIPLIIVSGSGGGARMYEGLFSLMQMAKTSGVLYRLRQTNLPYISVLTDPTMAGVMASFAGLGDIIIAEPKALIGFTGPRVIKQTIKQDLPKGFQTSEFNLEHGLIDMIVHRRDLKNTISKLLNYLSPAR